MKVTITEKQLKSLISNQIEEDDAAAPSTSATPSSGGGASGGGGTGYPTVGKWESGVTRGPANQIGNTKWSDIVGSILKRDKGNKLT
jgi:hypothetical protein